MCQSGTSRLWRIVALALLLGAPTSATASSILFQVTNIDGNRWRYDYTLMNDSLAVSVDEFTIYFDVATFANLSAASGPAPWDLLAIQPDAELPADGFFDGLVAEPESALIPGAVLGGFSVEFDFLGAGTPGSQPFEFLDSASLEVLDSGTTVPEPSVFALLAAAIALAGFGNPSRRARG